MKTLLIIIKIVLGLALLCLALILGPLLVLWSLNTLFPILSIPYTWQTVASAFILFAPFTGGIFKSIKREKR